MKLEKMRSPMKKHKGVIFIRKYHQRDSFICKVYAVKNAEEIADKIIEALK